MQLVAWILCNLVQNLIKKNIFRKTTLSTRIDMNGHNSACDQYFSLKLAPLYLVQTELSIHAKNSVLIIKEFPTVLFPGAGHIL